MTRHLEVLVEAHRQAHARRRTGLNPWAYTVPVAEALEEARASPPTVDRIGALTAEIARLLRHHLPPAWVVHGDARYDRGLDEILDRLDGTDVAYLAGLDAEAATAILDDILTELYDWADLHRVSCGLPGLASQPGRHR